MEKKYIKPKCPACGSALVLTRRDGISWCRRCGHEWKKGEQGNENNQLST